jgi:hypothetical protein
VLRTRVERLPLAIGAGEERHLGLEASPCRKGNRGIGYLSGFLYDNYLVCYFSISIRAARNEGDGYVIKPLKREALNKFRTLGLIGL